jgi:heme A synthase
MPAGALSSALPEVHSFALQGKVQEFDISGTIIHMRATSFVAVVVILSLALTGAAVAGSDATSAQLKIVRKKPLELRGERFKPNQSVALRVELGTKIYKRALRTNAAGTFTATFDSLVLDRCSHRLAVTAVGARGDRAEFELFTLPCPNRMGE